MTADIIDGRAIAAELRADLAGKVRELAAGGVTPGLAAVLVGDDPGSVSYVTAKAEACAEIGIFSETIRLPAGISQEALLDRIGGLNGDPRFHAILQQLPLPAHIDERVILDAIAPAKDVDGLHPTNLGRLLRGETSGPIPCTPQGVMHLLARSGVDPAGMHAVVVGRSSLVGRPSPSSSPTRPPARTRPSPSATLAPPTSGRIPAPPTSSSSPPDAPAPSPPTW